VPVFAVAAAHLGFRVRIDQTKVGCRFLRNIR